MRRVGNAPVGDASRGAPHPKPMVSASSRPRNGKKLRNSRRYPTFVFDADLGEEFEYEVLVFDETRNRRVVAAVEFVSPANKDRAEHRRAFTAKCAALLQKGIAVAIVDLVTSRHANLYVELLDLIDRKDPAFAANQPSIYAATCHPRTINNRPGRGNLGLPYGTGQAAPGTSLAARWRRRCSAGIGGFIRGYLPRSADRVNGCGLSQSFPFFADRGPSRFTGIDRWRSSRVFDSERSQPPFLNPRTRRPSSPVGH